MAIQQTILTLDECRSLAPAFLEVVAQIARDQSVSVRALTLRSLLQVPRLADQEGHVSNTALRAEVQSAAVRLAQDVQAYTGHSQWPKGEEKVASLVFGELTPELAEPIFTHLHYLRSYRPGSTAYALFHPKTHQPLATCLVSPLQWKNLTELIFAETGIGQDAVRDVSRVFVFDEAPKNSISRLLAKVRHCLAQTNREVRLLSTAVDQNLGFTGNSYRAANWQLFCKVQPRPYLYLDKEYKTIRQIQEAFGEERWQDIASATDTFEIGKPDLLESLVFIGPIHNDVEVKKVKLLHRQGL